MHKAVSEARPGFPTIPEGTPARRRKVPAGVWLGVVVAAYFALALAYGWLNPVFEAPDELWHYLYVEHLQQHHALPVQNPAQKETGPRQEGSQPPLYYALAAVLSATTPANDLPAYQELNYRVQMGEVFTSGERNLIYHTEKENVATSGTARRVHLLRLFSTLAGALTVLLTFAIAREVLPGSPGTGLVAAAMVGFLPQFAFLSGAVNNDNLAVAAATLCLWLLLRVRREPSQRHLVLLGLAVGVAALSKLSAVGTAGVVFLGVAAGPALRRDWRALARDVAIVGATAFTVAGWWYVRNLLLYGDPLGLNAMLAMVGGRERPLDPQELLTTVWLTKASFWALFGWTNVPADGWFYLVTDLITVLGLAGIVLHLLGSCRAEAGPRQAWVLLVWIAVAALALANWNRLTIAPQGRLLFPAIAPLAIFVAWGLGAVRLRGMAIAGPSVAVVMAGMSVYALFAYLLPSYRVLPVMAREALGDAFTPREIDFGGEYRLLGFRLNEESVRPGHEVPVTLYWQRPDPKAPSYVRFVHLEAKGELLAGGGDEKLGADLPGPVWSGDDVLRDERRLVVPENADAPLVADLIVGLYEADTQRRVAAGDDTGKALGEMPTIARVRVVSDTVALPAEAGEREVELGDQIVLAGSQVAERSVRPGEALRVGLYWRASKTPDADYTTFVHLTQEGRPVAQYDGQPRRGRYPTSAWRPGELVPDDIVLRIGDGVPPGEYHLLVGMYDLPSGRRLPTDGGDAVDLGTVVVAR